MKSNHLLRVEKYFFLKSKLHTLAIGTVSYFEIFRGCNLTNYLKDPIVGFVKKYR